MLVFWNAAPHKSIRGANGAPVAQLDRASGYEPEGREFESPRARHFPLRQGRIPPPHSALIQNRLPISHQLFRSLTPLGGGVSGQESQRIRASRPFKVVIGKTPRHKRRSCADNFSPGWSRQDARRLRLNKIFGSGREVVSTGGRLTVDVTPRGAIGRRNRGVRRVV